MGVHCGGSLKSVGRSKAVLRAKASRRIGNRQIGGDPLQLWIRGEQRPEGVYPLLARIAIGIDEQLGHRDGGGDGHISRSLDPLENAIGKLDIAGVGLDLINEDAGIEGNAAMTPKGRGQAD